MLQTVAAQTVVNSTFVGQSSPLYSEPNNWAPAGVPNNTESTDYNVTVSEKYVFVDIDATVSNLTLGGAPAKMYISNRTFTVAGTTQAVRPIVSIAASGTDPGTFDAGTLSAFSDGALTGEYELSSYDLAGPATLQFRDAQVITLRDAHLSLTGVASHVLDENGNDALRNLAAIDAASILALDGSIVETLSPLRVDGKLELGGWFQSPTIFTASASLTNFDPATRTLSGGSFALRPFFPPPDSGVVELRFAGADIVNNGSSIALVNDTSRITDLNGLDGLRNLARNLPGASLVLRNRAFVTPGNFTNDGNLALVVSSFTVLGTLTNFDAATRTLQNGYYQLEGRRASGEPTFRFAGADIVRNGAFLAVSGEASIADEAGNDGLRSFTDNLAAGTFIVGLGQVFNAPGDFTNAGRAETVEASGYFIPEHPPPPSGIFKLPAGATYTQTAGATINGGTFSAERLDILAGTLSGAGTIKGQLTIADATVFPGGVIEGSLTLSPGSRIICTLGEYKSINGWNHITGQVALAGTLEIEIKAENFLASTDVLRILRSAQPLTGNFSNAPDGTRITSVDGSGSFLVKYDAHTVTLTGFQANPPAAQLLNISGRSYIRPPDDFFIERVIIGGFIISGVEPKTVVLRGLAPSLVQAGVSSTLNDPTLGLYGADGNVIVANDNWRETQQAEIATAGLAPIDDREAAIHVTLSPGAYTAVLKDKSDSGGNGLVEVYDLSPGVNSKLGNISTLGFVDRENVLIGGIISGGAGQANSDIVVRALGPQLKRSSGIFSALEDPTLELRDSNGSVLAFSDGGANSYGPTLPVPWEFSPFFSTEEAIRVSLPRGRYTAIVRAKDENRGTALVEFYDLRR